jgi:hypothetical protein
VSVQERNDIEVNHSKILLNDQILNERQPLLYVDVNLGPSKSERIVVFDGDTAL